MDMQEYYKDLMVADYEQSLEMLRHYDAFHWDITKFCISQILVVIGACWYIHETTNSSFQVFNFFGYQLPIIVILLIVSGLFTLLCILALLRNRVYFCKLSNYINELRNNYLKTNPFGFTNKSKMWTNYKFPHIVDWISTQFLSIYLLLICLIVFACSSVYLLVSSESKACWCIFTAIVTILLVTILGYLVCHDNCSHNAPNKE